MTRCVRRRLVVGNALALLALLAAGACDEAPTPLTRPTPISPDPTGPFVVTVRVEEFKGASGSAGVEGATVEVLSSDRVGSATTDSKGMCQFTLPAGTATIRARKDGYDAELVTVNVPGQIQVYLTISPTVRGELGGHYTLTVTVSPGCDALPQQAREVTYDAHVATQGEWVYVSLKATNGEMVGWANTPGFTGTRVGNALRFSVTADIFSDYALISRIPGVGDLYHSGTATGEYRDDGIVAAFAGWIGLTPSQAPTKGCQAPDHRFVFRR